MTIVATREVDIVAEAQRCAFARGVAAERRRCVGLMLAYVGAHRLAHNDRLVAVLERIADDLEHPAERG